MHWANNILVQLGVICHQANELAVALRYEKGRRAPISRLVARSNDARGNVLGNLQIGGLLEAQGNRPWS